MSSTYKSSQENAVIMQLQPLLKRFETVVERLETLAGSKPTPQAVVCDTTRPWTVFETSFSAPMKEYLLLSEKQGEEVKQQAKAVSEAFQALKDFLYVASTLEKPDFASEVFQTLISPLQNKINEVIEYRDKHRGSLLFNHLSMVSEGIPALGWIAVEPTPVLYIGDMKDSVQFYANRILKEKDAADTKWVYSYIKLLTELQLYVKNYYNTGLIWNSAGSQDKNNMSTEMSSVISDSPAIETNSSTHIESVFAQLNMGESITSLLHKVEKSQMTHKNPSLRSSSTVSSINKPSNVSATDKKQTKLLPKKELLGMRWNIENFEDDENIVIDNLEFNQTVYIYNCKKCTIHLKGKANTVYIDRLNNCGLIIDTLISNIEFTRCTSFVFQVLDYVPTITLDQCDQFQIYLSLKCSNTEVITSKYSNINVHIPSTGDNNDYKECPVPEMFKSTIMDGKLVTNFVEYAS